MAYYNVCADLQINKSHFQDLTSTVSLRSGGLLSEKLKFTALSLLPASWPENLPASSTPKQQCTLMCHFVSQDLSKQIWNLKKWIVKTKFWFISFWGLLFSSASRFIKKLEIDKKVVSSCPTLWFSCFQTFAQTEPIGVVFFVSLKFDNLRIPPKLTIIYRFPHKKYHFRIHFPRVCRSLRLTLRSPNPWPFSKTCQAKPLELLALKQGV